MKFDIKSLREKARGKWEEILSFHGVDGKYLKKTNGPCPFCGGRDRWRWDNKNNEGGGFCHQCEAKGSGFQILGKWLNLNSRHDFPKLLNAVAIAIQASPESKIDTPLPVNKSKEYARFIWDSCLPLESSQENVALKYLQARGLFVAPPMNIRCHPNLKYVRDGKVLGFFPCMVARVLGRDGEFLGVHRTYLSNEGKKANVPAVKMALGPIRGGAIRFDEGNFETVNIAEGIETALAVREMSRLPTWAALSATNMASLDLPAGLKKIYIWADRDLNQTGERAAHTLARKLHHKGIQTYINMPPQPMTGKSTDWLDFYSECKAQEVSHV